MTINILTDVNFKKIFRTKSYDYILFDINSLTIVPYLNNEKYLSHDRIIITPFIETFKLYIKYKFIFPNARFIFIFDGGISENILKLYPTYKSNRHSRRYTGIKSNSVYDYNIGLLTYLFEYLNELAISDINRNESDFICGYIIKRVHDKKILTLSHDRDFLMMFNEYTDVIYKDITKERVNYFLIDCVDNLCHIMDYQYLKTTSDLLFYRALVGDVSDNITKPFGITSKKLVTNMFEQFYMNDIQITYELIVEYFNKKFRSDNIRDKFINDFRKNLYIMNVFNDDVISDFDKIKINNHLDEFMFTTDNKIEINLIYELFDKYGLFFSKDELDKIFNYLEGII